MEGRIRSPPCGELAALVLPASPFGTSMRKHVPPSISRQNQVQS
jgi:hypothetical protein